MAGFEPPSLNESNRDVDNNHREREYRGAGSTKQTRTRSMPASCRATRLPDDVARQANDLAGHRDDDVVTVLRDEPWYDA